MTFDEKLRFVKREHLPQNCCDCNECNERDGICEGTQQDISNHVKLGTLAYSCLAYLAALKNEQKEREWDEIEQELFAEVGR